MIITGNTDVVVRMSHVQVLTYQNQNLKDTLLPDHFLFFVVYHLIHIHVHVYFVEATL